MKTSSIQIFEWPEKTLFSRPEVAKILGIGQSTLDSLIPYSELPRVIIRKRVFIARTDLERYITSSRISFSREGKK